MSEKDKVLNHIALMTMTCIAMLRVIDRKEALSEDEHTEVVQTVDGMVEGLMVTAKLIGDTREAFEARMMDALAKARALGGTPPGVTVH